ncbi:MAG: hypothetical protein ACR2PH_02255, partial [Desulfobulbia bacterium]
MGRNQLRICWLLLTTTLLSGCASFSKGVTQAFLEHKVEDTRQCWISGRSFGGLENLYKTESDLNASDSVQDKLKVLMVHGIGHHEPGYSRRLQDGLVTESGFDSTDETIKTIRITHPAYPDSLGILRVHRYINTRQSREMLFFELTWNSIVENEKKLLSFDNSAEASVKRAPFNHTLKTFVNDRVSDALMYNSKYRLPIQLSVAQAICWILSESWENLPNDQESNCSIDRSDYMSQFDSSSFALISHSLGSRISIDALQEAMHRASEQPNYPLIKEKLRSEPIYFYMLSNQLPLLQLGQDLPKVHDQLSSVCSPEGDRYDERFFNRLQIAAFSDPNDLFSYAVTPQYASRYIDSRLCPSISNITVQVAQV